MFTALIGPYFVDWNAYRDTFEREASAYIGRPVNVAGKASLRLLPTPVLSFTNIRIGDDAAPDMEMERFRAEVELAPLLKGDVRIIQMAVERPRFHVDLARLQSPGEAGGAWRIDPERISLERLEIIDGTALITDSQAGRSWQAEDIDALMEAGSLMGPGRIDAKLVFDGEPLEVQAGFGRITADAGVAAKISVKSPDYPVTLQADGTLFVSERAPPRYEGTATVEGVAPTDDDAPRSPWADFRASGPFAIEPSALAIDEVQISYGAIERPLILQASGRIDFGARPHFDLSVGARQIDVDRTLGGGAENPVAIEDAFAAFLAALRDVPRPPFPGRLHVDAQGVVVGGSVVQGVGFDLTMAGERWSVDDFAAVLPGETRLDLDGTVELAGGPAFRGHARMASERPAALAIWWRGEVGSAARINYFSLESDLELGPERQRLAGLAATTGDGTITGLIELHSFRNSRETFATVDLRADRADILEARALAELIAGKALSSGAIDQMTASVRADVLSAGAVEARSVVLEGGFEDGRANLRRLSVADLAGASVDAIGSIQDPFGSPTGRIEASIKADDIGGAAAFLASLLPQNKAVAHLVRVAPILSPMQADVSVEAGAMGETDAADGPKRIGLTGRFAETHVTLQAEGVGSLAKPETLSGKMKLQVSGAGSAEVLAQLGLNTVAVQAGPLRIDADFDGALADTGALKLDGAIAGVDFAFSGDASLKDGEFAAAGDLKAESEDIDPALLLAGIALPGIGEGHAAAAAGRFDIAGDAISFKISEASFDGQAVGGSIEAGLAAPIRVSGSLELETVSLPGMASLATGSVPAADAGGWSDAPFAAPLPAGIALDLALKAARLELGAPLAAADAAFDLELADGDLRIELARAGFAGGVLGGEIVAAVRDAEADLALRATLKGGELQALVWERSDLPVASGKVDISFDAAGRGRSAAGIVATLSGSGAFAVSGGRFNALNPQALTAVMAAAEGDDQPDEGQARETFASQFALGALEFGRAAGSFSLGGGRITLPTISLAAEATTVLADAMLDLNTLTLASKWSVRIEEEKAEEGQPQVAIRFSGPIAAPERSIDIDPLLDLLRSRFLQRQLDQLEQLQERQRREEAERQSERPPEPAATGAVGEAETAAQPDPAGEADPGTQSEAALEPGPPVAAIATDPPAPAAEAPPIELIPQPPPKRTGAPPRSRRPPAAEPQEEPARYRTLPNGVVVKIR